MILIACLKCGAAVRTVGDAAEHLLGPQSEWYPNKYPCPRAECSGVCEYLQGVESSALQMLEIHDLSPEEAFIAFNGLGFPEEHDCGRTAVEKLFAEKRVKSVKVRQLPRQNRSVLEYIIFDDDTRLFLASSTEGATVYRVSKPHSYTKGAEHE
jgi:hypothetical protein